MKINIVDFIEKNKLKIVLILTILILISLYVEQNKKLNLVQKKSINQQYEIEEQEERISDLEEKNEEE
jgi:predicted RND superfamily exporter protein